MSNIEVTYEKNPYDHIIIDNVFENQELEKIFYELDFLTCSDLLNHSNSSVSNVDKKNNFFCNLDDLYAHTKVSPLVNLSNKLLQTEYVDQFSNFSHSFKFLHLVNFQNNFLSYYENNDYYNSHVDNSVITFLFYFRKKEDAFSGGELILDDQKFIEPKNNRCVIFTGCSKHSSSPVKLLQKNTLSTQGKYCFAKFLTIDPNKDKKEHPANILKMITQN